MSQAKDLIAVQECDLLILRAKKRLDELPEKQGIITVRAKRNDILKKRGQTVDMKDDAELKLKSLRGEDELLKDKMAAKQAQLDASTDYRVIGSFTKELEGLAKRREKIEFESTNLLERMEKIEGVQAQLSEAIETLDAQEEKLTASYRKNGHALKDEIDGLQQRRAIAAGTLRKELLGQYEKLRAAKNGIGAAKVEDKMCSVCRISFHGGELAKLDAGDGITICPGCKRLLVVRED